MKCEHFMLIDDSIVIHPRHFWAVPPIVYFMCNSLTGQETVLSIGPKQNSALWAAIV